MRTHLDEFSSFPELFLHRLSENPSKVVFRFFNGSIASPTVLTIQQLSEAACALAYRLQERGLQDQTVLIVCKSQQNFIVAFFAALLARVIAVPAAPARRNEMLKRLQLMARDARSTAVLFDCDEGKVPLLEDDHRHFIEIDMRQFRESEAADLASKWSRSDVPPQSTALLQYTSGSTGDPKGVMISHENLIHNCETIKRAMSLSAESHIFTALPLFHDMGLVGGMLEALYSNAIADFMSPAEFVQFPERWLQIISMHKITSSGGPNFMFDLAARSISDAQLEGVDLSHWQSAFVGADAIRSRTLEKFIERFSAYGFRRTAVYPCYGLAESVLFVTGGQVGNGHTVSARGETSLVGCGGANLGTRVEIVDPDTLAAQPEGSIGEIWVKGGSVAKGYWQRPAVTQEVFGARIANGDSDEFLRTGDLGYKENGELYIFGRLKDQIIINGKKISAQDLEETAENSHAALRKTAGAAFGVVSAGVERAIIVFELTREWLRRDSEWPEVATAVRQSIANTLGIVIGDVVLIKTGALLRTSSGKVRRSQCRAEYSAGTLKNIVASFKSPGLAS